MTGLTRSHLVWVKFLAAATALLLVWTILLPWIGRHPSMREMIDRNESLGIDPSAMFYTELENMRFRDGRLRRIAPP